MTDTGGDIKKCSLRALLSGVRPWWKAEAVPGIKNLGYFYRLIFSAIVILALIVHVLFLLGYLIAKVSMLDMLFDQAAAVSLIAFYNTADSVAIHGAIGASPIFLVGALYLWCRKVCAYGQPTT